MFFLKKPSPVDSVNCLAIFQERHTCDLFIGILPLRLETGRFQNIRDENTGHFRKLKVEERVYVLYVI